MKKYIFNLFFLALYFCGAAQPVKLEIGMKRNTAQTLMGKAKIDSYKLDRTVYTYPDSVFFTIYFDENELCKGFFWSGTNEATLIKTIEENGFDKRDSLTFTAKDLQGILQKETENSQTVFRFIPSLTAQQPQEKKVVQPGEIIPKERSFYGFTILGMKVWEKEEKKQ